MAALLPGLLLLVVGTAGYLVEAYPPIPMLVAAGGALLVVGWALDLRLTLVSVAVLAPPAGMAIGIANPALLEHGQKEFLSVVKWIPMAVPVLLAALGGVKQFLILWRTKAGRFFLGFLLWSLVAMAANGAEPDQYLKWLTVALLFVVSFGAIPALVGETRSAARVLTPFAWLCLFVFLTSLAMLVLRRPDAMVMGRFVGVFFNANALGILQTLAVLTFASLGLAARSQPLRVIFLVLAASALVLILLAGGRGTILGLLAGLAVLSWSASRISPRAVLPVGFLLLLAGLLVVQAFTQLDIDPEVGVLREKGGEEVRLSLLRAGVEAISDSGLDTVAGLGLGIVRMTYYANTGIEPHNAVTSRYRRFFPKLLHNSYLELLVETGVVGLLLVLGAATAGILAIYRIANTSPWPQAALHCGVLSIVVAYFVQSLFESMLVAPGGVGALWAWPLVGIYSYWSTSPSLGGKLATSPHA